MESASGIKFRKGGKGGKGWIAIPALGVLAFLVQACGQDCFEIRRMGDFEYSQGNYANAIRHYERALETDSACAGVKEKLAEARARNR